MYLARAFERRAVAFLLAQPPQQRGGRPLPLLAQELQAQPREGLVPPSSRHLHLLPPSQLRFRRLSPAEQLEGHCQGLCFNCDEPYVQGHVCKRLFYLESVDYVDDSEFTAMDDVGAAQPEDSTTSTEEPTANALAGIRTDNTMLLPVTLKGERLLALLDTGSTHTFLQHAVMRRLGLTPSGAEHLRVTVASGERLQCDGIAHIVPISIGGAAFPVTYVGLTLGCFDFILGIDFLRSACAMRRQLSRR